MAPVPSLNKISVLLIPTDAKFHITRAARRLRINKAFSILTRGLVTRDLRVPLALAATARRDIRTSRTCASTILGVFFGCASIVIADEPARTTFSDPSIRYSVPEKAYVMLARGDVEAAIVDNRAVDDEVLPGHRAGYSGVALLRHARRRENVFVPLSLG